MDNELVVVIIGAAAAMILFIVNLVLTAKSGRINTSLSRATYGVALATVIYNIVRTLRMEREGDESTLVFANVIVLICILVSFFRSEKPRENEPVDE